MTNNIEYLFVEPSSVCNLECTVCDAVHINSIDRTELPARFMSQELFKNIFDNLNQKTKLKYVEFQGLGEPLIAIKNLKHMIAYVQSHSIFSEITTNGMLLNQYNAEVLTDNGLNGIIISVDSADSEKFKQLRKHVNPELVKKNIVSFTNKYNSKIQTSINSVIHHYNINEIKNMVKYASDVGVDSIQFLHLINGNNELGFIKEIFGKESKEDVTKVFQEVEDYGKKLGILVLTPRLEPQIKNCTLPEKSITVAYDGRTNPCCRLDRPEYSYSGKMPQNINNILNEHEAFSQNYSNNDFCKLCTQFLWNYDVLMTKFKYSLNKKENGDINGI
jgi:sulfatase maturation enzyme AslB (radical SAM superfamily)